MKERYEELKMDVVVFDADVRTAEAAGVAAASVTPAPAVSPTVT